MDTTLKRSRGRPKSFNPNPEQTTVQALDRALVILRALAEGEGMSLTELAEASGQAPATVYRVLSTFQTHGMVEVQPATQLWFVGQAAFRIGSAFLGRTSLVEEARVVMRELMSDTGETANLAIADGGQVVFLSQVETHEPIRAFFRPGTRGPIHASGIGKALLQRLVACSAECGFRTMVAVIGGAEPASIALHAACGFAEAGRLRAVGWKFGRWLDNVYMQRDLAP